MLQVKVLSLTRGLASLPAIEVLHGDEASVQRVRQMPGNELTKELARIIDANHLRECTSWCFTREGLVENDQKVLSDFCPGYFVRSNMDPSMGDGVLVP